jgi:ribonucleoside-diphosphate reductase alpha chain
MSQLTDTAEYVLDARYYLTNTQGDKEDWNTMCHRISDAIGNDDTERSDFYSLIYDLDFLPNSPCLMNAGTDIGQLSACFVLPVEDSMESIFESIKHGALIHKSGGGTGYNFSKLRSKSSLVNSTKGVASGPLSFISVFDSATDVIKQGGKRRGANMAVLRIDHPDIVEFIHAKEDQTKYNNFNFSIAITDEFMECVKNDTSFDLIEPSTNSVTESISAKDVFNQIVNLAWKNGEPGVIFIDRINEYNPTPHLGDIEATNPCGEQPLLPFEACNLGSINLSNFIKDDAIDYERLSHVVASSITFLDNVVDKNMFPIREIGIATKRTRKLGLGIMGLHDILIQLGIAYNSKLGRSVSANIMGFIKKIATDTSMKLASKLGSYSAYVNSGDDISLRNAALTSIQPTGTVSMIADCASGCEPYFSVVVRKHVMDGTDLMLVNKHFETVAKREGFFSDELMAKVISTGTVLGHDEIPENFQNIFRGAQEISPEDHVLMQATLQTNGVDAAISKTINLKNDATITDVYDIYMMGYDLACKGLTVYRDGSRDHQVLNTTNDTEVSALSKRELPDVLDAKRYRLKDTDGSSIYIIIGLDERKLPIEVFAKFPFDNRVDLSDKATSWVMTCRLVSLLLRYGVVLDEIIKQLERSSGNMFDLPAQLSKLFKLFLCDSGNHYRSICPDCQAELIHESGCDICKTCGYSKCI